MGLIHKHLGTIDGVLSVKVIIIIYYVVYEKAITFYPKAKYYGDPLVTLYSCVRAACCLLHTKSYDFFPRAYVLIKAASQPR